MTKKDLVKKAEALGLDSVGTSPELEARIAAAEAEAKKEKETDGEGEGAKEEVKAIEAVRAIGPQETAKALIDSVKFIGQSYTLRKGKTLTAPRWVINKLRKAGFVL